MPDDESTIFALACLERFALGDRALLAETLATLDKEELRSVLTKLLALVDLRSKVGLDLDGTAEWARWLRSRGITV